MTGESWTILRIEAMGPCSDKLGNPAMSGECFAVELRRGSDQRRVRVGITKWAMKTGIDRLLADGILSTDDWHLAGRELARAYVTEMLVSQGPHPWDPMLFPNLTIDSHNVAEVCGQVRGMLAMSD